MTRDEWDDRASSLFEAGRRESPDGAAKRRTLERTLARVDERRSGSFAPFALAALAAALVGAFWLLTKGEVTRAPISAEQPRPLAIAASPSRERVSDQPLGADAPLNPPAQERRLDTGDGASGWKRSAKLAPAAPPTLEAELAVLDRARTELTAGRAAAALASLDYYATTLRGSHLALEARLLRIQALAALGERAQAAALARDLVARHPDSPLAERARSFTALDLDSAEPQRGKRP